MADTLNTKSMRKSLHCILGVLLMASCQSEEIMPDVTAAKGVLQLNLEQEGMPYVTRSVSDGLALTILDGKGTVCGQYKAGAVPSSITLDAGEYTLRAYSDNQDSWQTANSGLGEVCYWGETTVNVIKDQTSTCTYKVPVTNYGVMLNLPSLFSTLFTSYTFTVSSGARSVSLQDGQTAFFSTDAGFSYTLLVTNNEDVTNTHSASQVSTVDAGKIYKISYSYGE